jgi:hypothetical protein
VTYSKSTTAMWQREADTLTKIVHIAWNVNNGQANDRTLQGFEISRKTGYKIFDRLHECGPEALIDRSRRPWTATKSTAVV